MLGAPGSVRVQRHSCVPFLLFCNSGSKASCKLLQYVTAAVAAELGISNIVHCWLSSGRQQHQFASSYSCRQPNLQINIVPLPQSWASSPVVCSLPLLPAL